MAEAAILHYCNGANRQHLKTKYSLLSASDRYIKACNVRCTVAKSFMGLEFWICCGTIYIKFAGIVIFVGDSAELTNSFTLRTPAKMSKPVRVSLAFKAICTF